MKETTETKKKEKVKNQMKDSNVQKSKDKIEKKVKAVKDKKRKVVKCQPKVMAEDFPSDLEKYLDLWKRRDTGVWKFQKVIQSRAIEHCLDSNAINEELFDMLLPYLQTIQGGGRLRLLDLAEQVIKKEKDNEVSEASLNRANMIKTLMT